MAGIAALGFLLLVPLQISATLRLQQSTITEQSGRLVRAERQLAGCRQAVQKANSAEQLTSGLDQLGGPLPTPAVLALPLPLLKAEAMATIDQLESSILSQRSALPTSDPLRLLPDLIRPCIASLILAFAFASLARGSQEDREESLLDQLIQRLQARRLDMRRFDASKQVSEADYLRKLHSEDQE